MHRVRPRPCPACPYRLDCPAGVWDATEYAKLPAWDGDTHDQPPEWFGCHSDEGEHVCAGWAGHRPAVDLLGARIGVISGHLDPAIFDYRTDVPLFRTGAEAAAHGLSGISEPDDRTIEAIAKIMRLRDHR